MMYSVFVKDEGFSDLNPVLFGYEDCKNSQSFGPAVRTYWLIHFVVSGYGTFFIEGREYHVSPGEMFVIPPHIETYYEADSENPWNYIWIGFTANENITKKLPDIIKRPEAEKIFNSMKKCENFLDGRSSYLCARLWDLFAILPSKKNSKYDYVDEALECIHSEYMTNISVEEIANRLNLDRTYFSVIFKKKVGVSPKQYLLRHRMNVATTLLSDNISVSVVARSVGYSDLYIFSKMFKRHFGVSPTEYAKRQQF